MIQQFVSADWLQLSAKKVSSIVILCSNLSSEPTLRIFYLHHGLDECLKNISLQLTIVTPHYLYMCTQAHAYACAHEKEKAHTYT